MTNDTEIVLQDPSAGAESQALAPSTQEAPVVLLVPGDGKVALVGAVFGVDAIKDLLTQVMQAAQLDRNKDGNISRTEWIAALSSLAPSLFQADEVVEELKDLTQQELIELTQHIEAHFPDYTNVRNEVEDLVRQVFATLVELQKLIIAIRNLKAPKLT